MRTTLRSLCILRILCRAGGPVEESFIQSGLFILQEGMGETLDCNFYLDLQGPRSREVLETLITLEGEGKVALGGSPKGLLVEATEKGKQHIHQGGEWGAFFDVPPVRVPEVQIDAVLSLRGKEAPLEMAALGTALFLALSAASPGNILEELEKAKAQGMLAADFVERSVVEGFRRLRRYGIGPAKKGERTKPRR
jgi:hypothetical protein